MKKFGSSFSFLVIPLSRFATSKLKSFELKCGCNCSEVKKENFFVALNLVIEELYFSTSWKAKTKMIPQIKFLYFIKIIVKRPRILMFIHLNRKYELSIKLNCLLHTIDFKAVWYSNTAAKFGFPWAFDGQANGLDLIRDQSTQMLIFIPNNQLNFNQFATLPKTSKYTVIDEKDASRNNHIVIHAWNKTKLIERENIDVLHGAVLTKFEKLFLHNLDDSNIEVPLGLRPNHLWLEKNDTCNKVLITPTPFIDLGFLQSGIHINASTNFYHFISESLRPLVMAKQIQKPIRNIVIRSGLPYQFYEIIKLISPNSKIITLNLGERITIQRILYAEYENCLSSNSELFRGMALSDIKQSDEWIVWNWLREKWAPPKRGNFKLYLPRLKFESRGLVNGINIENHLVRRGFNVLNTRKASFEYQKECLSKTDIMCTTTGASLMNMIFLPENTKILEIGYPSGDSWRFLADLLGMTYISYVMESKVPTSVLESLDFYYARINKIDSIIKILT